MARSGAASSTRILFHYPGRGELTGGPRSVLLVLEAFHRKGTRTVLLTEEEGSLAKLAEPLVESVWVHPLRSRSAGAARSGLGLSIMGTLMALPAAVRFILTLFARLRAQRFDVIWTRGAKGVLLVGPVVKFLRLKLVWDVDLEFPSKGIYALINRLCLALSDLVITQSDRNRNELFGSFPEASRDRVVALLPPVPPQRVSEIRDAVQAVRAHSPEPSVLVVGTVSPRKNQVTSVRAFAILLATVPDARLDIVGPSRDPVYLGLVKAEIKRLDLCGHVKMHDWQDDVLDFMIRSDLLLSPSLAEGVPHVVREAMLVGLPVVASSVGGVPELIEDGVTGWLIDPTRPESIAATLERCLRDREGRARIAAAARSFAEEQLDPGAWVEAYTSRILRLVDEAHPQADAGAAP